MKTASRVALIAMASSGWICAAIMAVFAGLSIGPSRYDVGETLALAFVFGGLFAVGPIIGITALIFTSWLSVVDSPTTSTKQHLPPPMKPPKPNDDVWRIWRRTAFVVLCTVQMIALPISILLIADDDDFIPGCAAFHGLLGVAMLGVMRAAPFVRRPLSQCVIALHLIAMVLAVIAAAMEIESIVVSMFIVPLLGFACAFIGTRPHALRIAFGLSSPVFALVCAAVILLADWGPREAEVPVYVAMQVTTMIFVPVGLVVLWQALNPETEKYVGPPRMRWQFGLRELIGLMIAVALATGAARLFGDEVRVATAIGFALLTTCGLIFVCGKGCYRAFAKARNPILHA